MAQNSDRAQTSNRSTSCDEWLSELCETRILWGRVANNETSRAVERETTSEVPYKPEHYHTINAYLFVDDGKAAIDFYTKAFNGTLADLLEVACTPKAGPDVMRV